MADTPKMPAWLLSAVNHLLKVGVPLLAAFLLARYGIVLPVTESNAAHAAALDRQSAAMEALVARPVPAAIAK